MTYLRTLLISALSLLGLLSSSAIADNFILTGEAATSLFAEGFPGCNAQGCGFSDALNRITVEGDLWTMKGDGSTVVNESLEVIGYRHFADEVFHFLQEKNKSKLPGVSCQSKNERLGSMMPAFRTITICKFRGNLISQ